MHILRPCWHFQQIPATYPQRLQMVLSSICHSWQNIAHSIWPQGVLLNYSGILLPSKHIPFTAADTTELRQDNISILPPAYRWQGDVCFYVFNRVFVLFCGVRDKSHISLRVESHQSVLMNQPDRQEDGREQRNGTDWKHCLQLISDRRKRGRAASDCFGKQRLKKNERI